jgi:hypothetical protein
VDIASPGENIWVARRKKGEAGTKRVGQSQGTSPATATVAGIAALWLAHHGRNALLSKYSGKVKLQHVFLHLLRTTAQPWSHSDAGPGVVDAEALLKAPLPSATQVAAGLPSDPFRMLAVEEVAARMVGEPDPAPVRTHLDAAFGAGTAAAATPAVGPATAAGDVEGALATFGPELLHILAEDRAAALEFRASLRPAGPTAVASAPGPVTPTSAFGTSELARVASPTLRARLRR